VPIKFNSGAFYGLIASILLMLIVTKVRKKRAERGWKRYAEDKIYRPDEWEAKRKANDEQGASGTDSTELSKTSSTAPGDRELGSDEGSESVPIESNPIPKPNSSRVKKLFTRIKGNKK